MKRKFAFILMGTHYTPEKHQAQFETEKQVTSIFTVRSFEEARKKVAELQAQGVGAIELCGAFGSEMAKELIEQTQGTVAVGYVTHFPEQDALVDAFFTN